MSHPFEKPLRFKLDNLLSYRWWLFMTYMAAVVILLFFTALPAVLKICCVGCLLLLARWQWQKQSSLLYQLIQKDGQDWVIEDRNGNVMQVSLVAEGVILSWLIILCFRRESGVLQRVVVLPWMTTKESFRQLSVYMRTSKFQPLTDE